MPIIIFFFLGHEKHLSLFRFKMKIFSYFEVTRKGNKFVSIFQKKKNWWILYIFYLKKRKVVNVGWSDGVG